MDAIAKEKKKVHCAFRFSNNGEILSHDHQFVRCHMINDFEIKDFRRKARSLACGRMTDERPVVIHANVVSRGTFRIASTIAA